MKIIIKYAVISILLHVVAFYSLQSIAEDKFSTLINIGSKHFKRSGIEQGDLNEFNPGIGFEYSIDDDSYWTGGIFKNSFRNISVYGAYGITKPVGSIDIGLEMGLISGYPRKLEDEFEVNPLLIRGIMLAPYARYKSVKIFIIGNGIGLQVKL